MKIDEGCINHNVANVIDIALRRVVSDEELGRDGEISKDEFVGCVRGVLSLAKELKEVLKA